MSRSAHDVWSDRMEQALAGYSPDLVRSIAARLLKTRSQWPIDELIERIREASTNAPLIDRRLKDIPLVCRKILSLIGASGRPDWRARHLLAMLETLGHAEGAGPLQTLFEEGLIFPVRMEGSAKLKTVQQWLIQDAAAGAVFAHPFVAQRARTEDLGLPVLPPATPARSEAREADGLEWPLRLAVAWQQVAVAPLRLTLQQDFFKRDLLRLQNDPLLTAPFAESLVELPEAGLLAVAWAEAAGLLQADGADLLAAGVPEGWHEGLAPTLAQLWRALPDVAAWDPVHGWQPEHAATNPFPSSYLPALLLLARQPSDPWLRVSDLERWLVEHHPNWGRPRESGWANALFAGLFFQLRLVQCAAASGGDWLVRLSATGRWLVGGERTLPASVSVPQTLIAQANYEILAFRQGLTPDLIIQLTRLARWKALGTACLLELNAEQVYRGLESGLTFEEMQRLLQRHGLRPTPDNVVEALRTWASKRDRVTVYDDATLIEFATAEDLTAAIGRGLVEHRLTERIGLVGDENTLDFKQFRLTGTRDYRAKAERCVSVADDGVTLFVDGSRADLVLDTELARLAVEAESNGDATTRIYRLTRPSLRRAVESGWSVAELDHWLTMRAGEPLSPAARLLAAPDGSAAFRLERCLVLHTPTASLADGLMQWQGTRNLVRQRLGPTALLVAEEDVPSLREQLALLSQTVQMNGLQ